MDISPRTCFSCDQFKPVVVRNEHGKPVTTYCQNSMIGCERLNKYLKGNKK